MSQADIANKFISDWNNKSIEAEDPTALDQCMDLAFKYCDALGIDRAAIRHQYAYQVWANATDLTRKNFDLLENTPTFIPQVGDLAVFKQVSGIPVGHISVVAQGTSLMNLVSFDQNWDTLHYYHVDNNGNHIPYSRQVIHNNYYGVVGFLRPKLVQVPAGDDVTLNKIGTIYNGSGTPHDKVTQIKALF